MSEGPVHDISGRGGGSGRDAATARPAPRRVLIVGPSGAGTSTLGRHLAIALATQHFDVDDFYWRPSDPPFRRKRTVPARVALMREMFLPRRDWVLSGALESWGEAVVDRLTHAVFLTLDQPARRARLEARERIRHGAAMDPGGTTHAEVRAFLSWADGYEAGMRPGRSLARHEAWLATLPCPVIRLQAGPPPEALAGDVLEAMAAPAH